MQLPGLWVGREKTWNEMVLMPGPPQINGLQLF